MEQLPEQNEQELDLNKSVSEINEHSFLTQKLIQKRQNISLIVIGVMGFLVLILAFWQLNKNLQIPWPGNGDNVKPAPVVAEKPTDVREQDPDELKLQDTDEDKISDFDEIYVYGTSPYLSDTDSDGIEDLMEIQQKLDPLCPQGQSCYKGFAPATSDNTMAQTMGTNTSPTVSNVKTPTSSLDEYNLSASDLRKLIISSGQATTEQLDLVDDATLVQLFNQMLEENPQMKEQLKQNTTTKTETAPDSNFMDSKVGEDLQATLNNLSSASPAELRNYFLSAGISKEDLDMLADSDILEMYRQAVEAATKDVDLNQ